MRYPFEVVVDHSGRVEHYAPTDFPNTQINPEDINGYIDGGERAVIKGVEYDLTENGSLIHPDVNARIGTLSLGSGVRIDQGTTFEPFPGLLRQPLERIVVGDRTRIRGTAIRDGVSIGQHALILASSVGSGSAIGDHSRLGEGVKTGSLKAGTSVRIDRDAWIDNNVTIGDGARIGYATRILEGAIIGRRARIGKFTGAGPRVNQDGPLIRHGQVVAAREVIED
jgi:carbonic anhydrase/acetyltransferase-like protein (isoleucine patch superfamily)